jgi:hypothetical protein
MAEEKRQLTEEEMKESMANEAKKMEERYDQLFKELEDGGYFDQTYAKDSKVEIPGSLFNSFIWFVNEQSKHMNSVRQVLGVIDSTLNGLSNNVNAMTMRLMEQHKENVDSGNTISLDQQKEEDAVETVNEIQRPEKKSSKGKKKASVKVVSKEDEG